MMVGKPYADTVMSSQSLNQLMNIGKTVSRRLGDIGVTDASKLRTMGAAEAYRRLSEANPNKHLPVCYYLYSLEGAIQGRHWTDFSDSEKETLLAAAGFVVENPES